jgi:RimJ/RimL family protein N-acetyltransferase
MARGGGDEDGVADVRRGVLADDDGLDDADEDAGRAVAGAFTPAEVRDSVAFEARWTRQRADPSVLVRTIERDGEVVGSIASWDAGGAREVTYWIGRRHWGQGIASQALRMFLEL